MKVPKPFDEVEMAGFGYGRLFARRSYEFAIVIGSTHGFRGQLTSMLGMRIEGILS